MTFWQIFLRVLLRRPLPALGALYWHVTGRRLRARDRLRATSATLPFAYDLWITTVEQGPESAQAAAEAAASWSWKPRFLILIYESAKEEARASRESVEQQFYPFWTIIECEHGLPPIPASSADYVVPIKAGDRVSPSGLFYFARALQEHRSATILYGDQDELDARGKRVRPWFKPRWNPEMFLGMDYLSQAVAIEAGLASRTQVLNGALTQNQLGEALLDATAFSAGSIVHVPHVVAHVSLSGSQFDPCERAAMVARHLESFEATCALGPFGTARVSWPLPPELPRVSIIIPTRDQVELLSACVDSVLRLTSYPHFEISIVDNGSVQPETLSYLARISTNAAVRLLRYDEPYNFSAINNFAVQRSEGTFMCFLNNDTEIIEPNWLSEMMRYAVQSDVGAVGAKLLYADGTIQHAGIALGLGDAAGHSHRFTPADQPGYFRQPHVSQSVTAVTAACLVVEKQKFEAVHGFDAKHFAIAYNDVDLCLKLQAAGFRNIYVPHAVLLHHESKSRGSDLSPGQFERYMRELQALQERWEAKSFEDPLHNPNLDRYSESYMLRL